ncbi:MAG: hypothetical protein FWG52_09845 [Proteobacteria bacterium]|nr:hypothetical protein [Pseudomonadota bacterium]
MKIIRKIRVALLTRKLHALIRDISFARRDAQRHINQLRREVWKTEQRLFTLTLAQRNKGSTR